MKELEQSVITHLQDRRGTQPVRFVWVEAKNRSTGALETMGLCQLDDTVTQTVISGQTLGPVTRVYHGIGGNLKVPPIQLTTDLTIRRVRIGLSQISEAAQQLIRGYETRRAPVEIHLGYCDPETSQLIAPPRPIFVGFINGNPVTTPSANNEGGIDVECVSHVRRLTFTNPAKRSDEQQRLRQGDRFRRYTDVAGGWVANISWGEEGGKNSGGSATTGFSPARSIESGDTGTPAPPQPNQGTRQFR